MLARQHVNLTATVFVPATYGIGVLAENGNLSALPQTVVSEIATMNDPVPLLILTTIALAFGLVPDFDEPGSTVSRKLGWLSRIGSKVFRILMGGHREGSHTLLLATIFGVIGFVLQAVGGEFSAIVTGVFFVLSTMLIIKLIMPLGLGKTFYGFFTLAAIALAVIGGVSDNLVSFGLGYAMFMGMNLHCLGDSLTPDRVKWLAPFYRGKVGININGRTGGGIELGVTQPILILTSALVLWTFIIRPLMPDEVMSWLASLVA